MNKSEVERRTKEIVSELSIIDSFLEEGNICQPKMVAKHGIFHVWGCRLYQKKPNVKSTQRTT